MLLIDSLLIGNLLALYGVAASPPVGQRHAEGSEDGAVVLAFVHEIVVAVASIGGTITIDPVVETDISESDLEYRWEVLGDSLNGEGHRAFFPLVDSLRQGKRLIYQGKFDSNITMLNSPYTCRLHVIQKSTGRDFYSANTFTITISGITGLMILHGDDDSCDIGILDAKTFTPMTLAEPDTPSVVPNLYSGNNGRNIDGKPKSITQAVTYSLMAYAAYYTTINERGGKFWYRLTRLQNG